MHNESKLSGVLGLEVDRGGSASVFFKDGRGVLHSYDRRTSKDIIEAAAEGQTFVKTGRGRGVSEYDLKNMKQLKRRGTYDVKDIVIEIPWSAKRLKAVGSLKGDDSFCRKILEMAVDRIRGKQSLDKILDFKSVPRNRSVEENPYLRRGHTHYDNFLDSLLKATFNSNSVGGLLTGRTLYDAVLGIVFDGPAEANLQILEDQGLRLVFHGTNEASMTSILKTGLLPEFRRSGGKDLDWFGLHYWTSLGYTMQRTLTPCTIQAIKQSMQKPETVRIGTKILLFMVLRPQVYLGPGCQYATSTSSCFQLPIATVDIHQRETKG